MNEFKNNKEGKIDELKVGTNPVFVPYPQTSTGSIQKEISGKKSALQKHAVIVKTQQKEHQTATLELGVTRILSQCG